MYVKSSVATYLDFLHVNDGKRSSSYMLLLGNGSAFQMMHYLTYWLTVFALCEAIGKHSDFWLGSVPVDATFLIVASTFEFGGFCDIWE